MPNCRGLIIYDKSTNHQHYCLLDVLSLDKRNGEAGLGSSLCDTLNAIFPILLQVPCPALLCAEVLLQFCCRISGFSYAP